MQVGDGKITLTEEFLADLNEQKDWKARADLLGGCLGDSIDWMEIALILMGNI